MLFGGWLSWSVVRGLLGLPVPWCSQRIRSRLGVGVKGYSGIVLHSVGCCWLGLITPWWTLGMVTLPGSSYHRHLKS